MTKITKNYVEKVVWEKSVCGKSLVWEKSGVGNVLCGKSPVWEKSCVGKVWCGKCPVLEKLVWEMGCGKSRCWKSQCGPRTQISNRVPLRSSIFYHVMECLFLSKYLQLLSAWSTHFG